MYIFFDLGNNYIRGDNMSSRRIKLFLMPIVYGVCIIAFLFSMYFIQKLSNNVLFSDDNELEYVDGEITEDLSSDMPVVSTSVKIVRPYLDNTVSIAKTFYDYEGEVNQQENSIIFYEDTYMQNSGVDYGMGSEFEVVSILEGTIMEVVDDDFFHKNIPNNPEILEINYVKNLNN